MPKTLTYQMYAPGFVTIFALFLRENISYLNRAWKPDEKRPKEDFLRIFTKPTTKASISRCFYFDAGMKSLSVFKYVMTLNDGEERKDPTY